MASTGPPFTGTLDVSSVSEAGPATKSLAGGETANRLSKPKPTQAPSPTTSKRTLESESSDDSMVDAGTTWELDLERVHGLTNEEVCIVVSKVARYSNQYTFPDPNGDRFMEFAQQEWKHMRELMAMQKEYPECDGQTCINGEWIML